MKRTVSLLLALVMVFALAACSKENNETKDDGSAGDVEM